MDVPIETLQSFWDTAWENAPEAANTLKQQLRNYEVALTQKFQTTGIIASVSKNSASQSYRAAALGSLTILQAQTAWRTLIKLYNQTLCTANELNQCSPWFQEKYPNYAQDPDQAVYDLGYCWLSNDFTQIQTDMTYLRLAPTLVGQNERTW